MKSLIATLIFTIFFCMSSQIPAGASELMDLDRRMEKAYDHAESITWIRDWESHKFLSEKNGTLKIELAKTPEAVIPYLVFGYIADRHIYTSKLIMDVNASAVSLRVLPDSVRGGVYSKKSGFTLIPAGVTSEFDKGLQRSFVSLERRVGRSNAFESDAYVYFNGPMCPDPVDISDYRFWECASVFPMNDEDIKNLGILVKNLSNPTANVIIRIKGVEGSYYDFQLSKEQRAALNRTWRYYLLSSGKIFKEENPNIAQYMKALNLHKPVAEPINIVFAPEQRIEGSWVRHFSNEVYDDTIVARWQEFSKEQVVIKEERRLLEEQQKILDEQKKMLNEQKKVLYELKKLKEEKIESKKPVRTSSKKLSDKYIKQYWKK